MLISEYFYILRNYFKSILFYIADIYRIIYEKQNRKELIHKVRNVKVGSNRYCGKNQIQLLSA